MSWLEAIKAAVIAIPKIVDLFKSLTEQIQKAVAAAENRHLQEIRDAQRKLEADINRLQNDQDRKALVHRLAELERRL